MNKKDLRLHLDKITRNAFNYLCNEKLSNNCRLKIAEYKDGAKRFSEQELRFAFVEEFNTYCKEHTNFDCYYQIEVPTSDNYTFSANQKKCKPIKVGEGRSACIDLVIVDSSKNKVALIEFKANSADKHAYAKDIAKLSNLNEGDDNALRYFINLFEKSNENTWNKYLEKISSNYSDYIGKEWNLSNIIFLGCSIEEKVIKELQKDQFKIWKTE